ncbi:hypothetical protein NQZ68_027183 [Dissostichus eleginoides]|nr:hypothetical protein NQZ68_027183 [Dissostichus eleginoides]
MAALHLCGLAYDRPPPIDSLLRVVKKPYGFTTKMNPEYRELDSFVPAEAITASISCFL